MAILRSGTDTQYVASPVDEPAANPQVPSQQRVREIDQFDELYAERERLGAMARQPVVVPAGGPEVLAGGEPEAAPVLVDEPLPVVPAQANNWFNRGRQFLGNGITTVTGFARDFHRNHPGLVGLVGSGFTLTTATCYSPTKELLYQGNFISKETHDNMGFFTNAALNVGIFSTFALGVVAFSIAGGGGGTTSCCRCYLYCNNKIRRGVFWCYKSSSLRNK